MLAAPFRLLGAPSYLETVMVLTGRLGPTARAALDHVIAASAVNVAAFTRADAILAIDAFLRFGKGRHPAALNFGDCCSYALAADTGLPLLFKGTDFARTDVRPAIAA